MLNKARSSTKSEMLMSNISHFRGVVHAAHLEWYQLGESSLRPNPNNEKGHIITLASRMQMFRQALVCIVFCGVYLGALLVIKGRRKFGEKKWDKYFDKLIYEAKLELLGCSDLGIITKCRQFRKARNDIIHERPEFIFNLKKRKDISKETKNAIDLIKLLEAHFSIKNADKFYKTMHEFF